MKLCEQCGLELGSGILICPRCGQRAGVGLPKANGMRVAAPILAPTTMVSSAGLKIPQFAGFGKRTAAFLIDLLLVSAISTPVMLVFPYFTSIVIWWLYSATMESSSWQATLGKRALDLKVTDVNGARLFFGRASVRFFAKFLSSSIFGIGFLMVLWSKHKQGLHDMISGCLVYRRE